MDFNNESHFFTKDSSVLRLSNLSFYITLNPPARVKAFENYLWILAPLLMILTAVYSSRALLVCSHWSMLSSISISVGSSSRLIWSPLFKLQQPLESHRIRESRFLNLAKQVSSIWSVTESGDAPMYLDIILMTEGELWTLKNPESFRV